VQYEMDIVVAATPKICIWTRLRSPAKLLSTVPEYEALAAFAEKVTKIRDQGVFGHSTA